MLLLSLCHPRVEPTEEMRCLWWNPLLGYLRRNPLCSHLHAAVSIGLPPEGRDGPPWMESRLKPRTAVMDGICICRTYCHSLFYNYMWFPCCVQEWLLSRNPSEPSSGLPNKALALSWLHSVNPVLPGILPSCCWWPVSLTLLILIPHTPPLTPHLSPLPYPFSFNDTPIGTLIIWPFLSYKFLSFLSVNKNIALSQDVDKISKNLCEQPCHLV
jgi:hypothetical protein